ncbi:MAG: Crp/Fnr family transcriptional regulator [Chroococcidiopsidaceae cyanobacterium CP_BM_ER_R8_30]|nr:Crp/Fnr family transcriptional regulator [Chroococcidiopsidaceae cyanobacterium CP_BM_ER_R8_30]
MSNAPQRPIRNRLITALSAAEYQRLVPHMEFVSLSNQQVLYEPKQPIEYVYFPDRAVVSLLSMMSEGSTVEVSVVSNEGVVGLPVILGHQTTTTQAIVQVADGAIRMEASVLLAEFNRGGTLQRLLMRYTHALLTQLSQTVACNRIHTVKERLARWLLTISDCIQSDQFPLTQEFIAQILGARRSSVTVAAETLQQTGSLRYSHGRITILNRSDLEATACECYEVIKAEFEGLLNTGSD